MIGGLLAGTRRIATRLRRGWVGFVAVPLLASGAFASDRPALAAEPDAPALLSAYFGLDDGLPPQTSALCPGGAGLDGMPVVFSSEIDPETVQPNDFVVNTAFGAVKTPRCATLQPAVDAGELRTVLLIGEFGNAGTDPPTTVEVVGEIRATGNSRQSFLGARVAVAPLHDGPTIVLAESVPSDQWSPGRRGGLGRGSGCPVVGTEQIVRATWAGGITNAAGNDPDATDQARYRVRLRDLGGQETIVTPFAVSDLGDGDNNHLLCLDVPGEPLAVFYPAGHLYDPSHDAPNPDTVADLLLASDG